MVNTTTENTEPYKHHYKCEMCDRTYVVEHDQETLYADDCPNCGYQTNDPHEIT